MLRKHIFWPWSQVIFLKKYDYILHDKICGKSVFPCNGKKLFGGKQIRHHVLPNQGVAIDHHLLSD